MQHAFITLMNVRNRLYINSVAVGLMIRDLDNYVRFRIVNDKEFYVGIDGPMTGVKVNVVDESYKAYIENRRVYDYMVNYLGMVPGQRLYLHETELRFEGEKQYQLLPYEPKANGADTPQKKASVRNARVSS